MATEDQENYSQNMWNCSSAWAFEAPSARSTQAQHLVGEVFHVHQKLVPVFLVGSLVNLEFLGVLLEFLKATNPILVAI